MVLVDESRLASNLSGRRFYKIENLIFIAMGNIDPDNDRLMRRLDIFQQLVCSFGYYSLFGNATVLTVDKSK